jgi:hypothetical protein
MNDQVDVALVEHEPHIEPTPVVAQPEPEKILYSWTAPSRLFKQRNREFYSTVLALVILLSVILLFAKEFLLIGVILSFGFFTYVLASIPPEEVKHSLTNRGMRTAKKLHRWNDCSHYWWEKKWNEWLLHVDLISGFPHRAILLVGEGNKAEIDEVIGRYVIKEKPDPTWLDKAAAWLQEKVPLEEEGERDKTSVKTT